MISFLNYSYEARLRRRMAKIRWYKIHLDKPLCLLLLTLGGIGLLILYSAADEQWRTVLGQGLRLVLGFILMLVVAQISPDRLHKIAPWLYGVGFFLLLIVLLIGKIGHGAARWLDFGLLRFQPSEIMKLAMPMMLAYYLNDKPLPPRRHELWVAAMLLLGPMLLTAKEPDLGTAILIGASGFFVLVLAGLQLRLLVGGLGALAATLPLLWYFLHHYQKERVLTFLHPERDPLGSGYNIIQSKIAIGSGGWLGKGWLHGTQSHLQFLPAHTTDFIFAVTSEEWGLVGNLLLIFLYFIILVRCLYISSQAQNTFSRLLSGSLSLSFFFSAFINMGMVVGILPAVGVPLPLVSYGGTSLLTLMLSFGIIMAIHTHRKLLPN